MCSCLTAVAHGPGLTVICLPLDDWHGLICDFVLPLSPNPYLVLCDPSICLSSLITGPVSVVFLWLLSCPLHMFFSVKWVGLGEGTLLGLFYLSVLEDSALRKLLSRLCVENPWSWAKCPFEHPWFSCNSPPTFQKKINSDKHSTMSFGEACLPFLVFYL